jgi:ribosomal protein S18 acetylase RimI-like enzyme
MKIDFAIRNMVINDYDEIYNLWNDTHGVGLSGKDDSKEYVDKFINKNPKLCFIAEYRDKIIGTIMAGDDGRRGHIYHLVVDTEYRNNGIGKELVNRVEKEFKDSGINKIFLVAFNTNEIGNEFWEKNGYKIRNDLIYRDKRIAEQ